MPQFFGICGRNNPRPCRLAWSSRYNHPRVGTYPSDLLPSTRTLFYLSSDGSFSFRPPVVNPGDSFGLPLVGGFTISGQFSNQFDTFNPDTRAVFSFCRTANRLNVAHVITQQEISSVDPISGLGEIDVGEYVFDAIAVTDQTETIDTQLSEQDKKDIAGTESESDRAFRKLFEQNIPDERNRLHGVKVNSVGIEFRLDNGDPKSISALETNGNGNFVGAGAALGYRDGSSRILLVDLKKITQRLPRSPGSPTPSPGSLQDEARQPKAGDVIYLTYVAVKQHYMRYSINAKWSIHAMALPPQCFSVPTIAKVAIFRFYEWQTQSGSSIASWRAVETSNIPVNFVAPMVSENSSTLGDFIIGGGRDIQTVQYMPGNSSLYEIQRFIQNKATLPSYQILLNQPAGDASFHVNLSAQGSFNAYRKASWFSRENYTTYSNWLDAQSHILFNIHPKALNKRDIDKFGINRFLATEIQQDINSGKLTFFPFMDEFDVDVPINGSKNFLDASNTRFSPIQPLSVWTVANLEVDCAVGSSQALFPGGQGGFNGTGDVFAVFGIASPVISETFEKDTRLLVEIFATSGAASGPNTIAIQGSPSVSSAVSCINDLRQETAFVCHSNEDNLLVSNVFDYGHLSDGLRKLDYRPDQSVSVPSSNSKPSDFESLLGYSGMLGDYPGFQSGLVSSIYKFSSIRKFRFKTNSRTKLKLKFDNIADDQIEEMTVSKSDTKISIPVSTAYCGNLEIEYANTSTAPIDLLILIKSGSDISGSIDSITILPGSSSLSVNYYWLKGDMIEIIGQNFSKLDIKFLYVTQIDTSIANDFLNEQISSQQSDKNAVERLNFYTKSVLFNSSVMSLGQDGRNNLFLFFEDKDNGISCAQSNDNCKSWTYHYGVIESINERPARSPFVLSWTEQNKCFVFYRFENKILCKSIPMSLFRQEDSLIIERFEKDRLNNSTNPPTEKTGLFSNDGKILRRDTISYAAAGDLTDGNFLQLTGLNLDTHEYNPHEERNIETQSQGETVVEKKMVRKQPLAIGSNTAFLNASIDDLYFSAYRTNSGAMKLFYLSLCKEDIGGGKQLQCNFSSDDGKSWYDLLEYISFRFNRFRIDESNRTQFIDRSADGQNVDDIRSPNPMENNQLAAFGINVHWSRLKRHKIEGVTSYEGESKTVAIEAPYVFYHSFLDKVFLFYVYSGCLLCKIFDESVFYTRTASNTKMQDVKDIIEKQTRAYFVDGDLSTSDIREELHYFTDTTTKQRQTQGNIIFIQHGGIERFNNERRVSEQRVCAYRFGNCNVRVFYKLANSKNLHAATWNGSEWFVEEFMKNSANFPLPRAMKNTDITDVTGGFGQNAF